MFWLDFDDMPMAYDATWLVLHDMVKIHIIIIFLFFIFCFFSMCKLGNIFYLLTL